MAVNLPKIADTPYLSLYCNSTKQNDNVTMTFPVNSSLQCFRTAALSMVTLNMESRSPMGRVNAENHSKTWKSSGVNGLRETVTYWSGHVNRFKFSCLREAQGHPFFCSQKIVYSVYYTIHSSFPVMSQIQLWSCIHNCRWGETEPYWGKVLIKMYLLWQCCLTCCHWLTLILTSFVFRCLWSLFSAFWRIRGQTHWARYSWVSK